MKSLLKKRWIEFLEKHSTPELHKQLAELDIDVTGELPIVTFQKKFNLQIDFNRNLDYRRSIGSMKTELLSRALGAGKKGLSVIDFSAGLAIDSLTLVRLGFEVLALERHPLTYFCLQAAYNEWQSELKSKLRFEFASSGSFLSELPKLATKYELAYFDPMFPHKKKSALPRQEMVVFQHLTGEDLDSVNTFAQIVQSDVFKRVVVKRPIKASLISDLKVNRPFSQIKGKLIRYDIYN